MAFNSHFSANSGFRGRFRQNEIYQRFGNPIPGPNRMMKHDIPPFHRFLGPPVRGPPPVPFRPPHPNMNDRGNFFRNETFISGPRMPAAGPRPLITGPRPSLSGPLVRQPYFGNTHYSQGPPNMRGQLSVNNRFFVPWNHKPWMDKPPVTPKRETQYNQSSKPHPPRPTFANKPAQKPIPNPVNPTSEAVTPKKKKRRLSYKRMMAKKKVVKPWMTEEIYKQVLKKNELYFKAKKSEKEELWQEFRTYRNKVGAVIKDAKVKAGIIVRKPPKEEDQTPRPHSCDICDKAYEEESGLEEHLKEHVKCGEDGCQFEAHPKVILLHQKMQHESGYASVIQKLNDPEEIERWRNERKRRFPTAENVKQRQQENEEKISRGEVIEKKDFGSRTEDLKTAIPSSSSGEQVKEEAAQSKVPDKEGSVESLPATVNKSS